MVRRVSEHGGPPGPTMNCAVLVPMLGRAEHVPRLVDSLAASTDQARIVFICTAGDDAVLAAVADHDHLVMKPRERGDYATKINTGIKHTTEPLIFTAAIDIHFHPGWLDRCTDMLSDTVRVVGTNDLTNDRTAEAGHSTHTLVARDYADRGLIDGRPGLLCPDYLHEFVDDELIGTAIKRGVYRHCRTAIVEHLHPIAGKADWDSTYRGMQSRMSADRALFDRRRQLWT